jgi:maltooligosyltrehalose trehalohydrolase
MQLLPLDKLGAREINPGTMQFGVFLPWVSAGNGNQIFVKIIHEKDQFLQGVQPLSFPMGHSLDPDYGDYWSAQLNIGAQPPPAGSSWGQPGTYLYRYEIHNPNVGVLDWIVDPFAREFGVGKLSAFTLGFQEHPWSPNELAWKTPKLRDLIMYELQLDEFGGSLNGAIERLDYLRDLGINCIEVMPVSNVALNVDWGFLPIGYFGVDERFGNRRDLQRLVDAAHQRGIAVVLDVVYGHTSSEFPYSDTYRRLKYQANPFLGDFAKNMFGESTDFNLKLTQDFFYSVNFLWLDRFHVDGFRYDCVPNFWDGATGKGYANLVFSTYDTVKAKIATGGHWQRFSQNNEITVIQCAEQLEDAAGVLAQSYSNCTWQDGTYGTANAVARGYGGALTEFGFKLGLDGYIEQATHNADTLTKTALQYIENHDHQRFVCNFGMRNAHEGLFQEGNRDLWYKVQPYLIALLCAKGIPMLWQGQEFAENYWLPDRGLARTMLLRPVRWDYFYDDIGKTNVRLVRKLIALRRQNAEYREGQHFYYQHWERYQSKGVLMFSRFTNNNFSLVALNFSDAEQTVPFWFPVAGDYAESLHGNAADFLQNVPALTEWTLKIPSNYGRIWRKV